MSLATLFGFSASDGLPTELPEIYTSPMAYDAFVNTDIVQNYTKIITDVIERTHGVPEELLHLLWDNCVQSEASDGLVTLLAKSMADQKELFLVYKPEIKVIRQADITESNQIRDDYAKSGKSSLGVYISFKNYKRTDMVKLYSGMEYTVINALSKSLNLSKAIQFKMNDLRSSVSLADSDAAKNQAKDIADGLAEGLDVLLDAKDEIVTHIPDLNAIKESIMFLDGKRCFYLGMPMSYINGEMQKGLGDSGEADAKAIERGLKNYFFSIIKPVLEAVFTIRVTFKSNDFRMLSNALDALKTFSVIDDEIMSPDDKKQIIEKLLDLKLNGKPTADVKLPDGNKVQPDKNAEANSSPKKG